MNKIKQFFIKIKPSRRRIIQLFAALLVNSNVKGYITGNIYKGPLKSICGPGLNCYSCPGASLACPIGSLQNALSETKTKTISFVLGIILLYSIILGRMICGYLCPTGLIQDLLYKIKTPKLKKNKVTYVLSYFKYFVLAVFVIGIPLFFGLAQNELPLPSFCKYICPSGTIGGGVLLLSNPNNSSFFEMLGGLFTWKFIVAIFLCVVSIFVYRPFCRFLCPLGALYGLFNRLSILGIHIDESTCTHCNACISKCKMDIKKVGDQECINCGECRDVCATHSISFRGQDLVNAFHKMKQEQALQLQTDNNIAITSMDIGSSNNDVMSLESETKEQEVVNNNTQKKHRRIKKYITYGACTSLLIGVMVYVNFFDNTPSPSIKYGNQVGDVCVNQEIKLINNEEGTFSVIDNLGKVIVINFWGTWCTPCIEELPEFDQVYKNYSNHVEIIAIHQAGFKEATVNSFIQGRWPSFTIHFGIDDQNDPYFTKMGGMDVWPITTIVDKEGVIAYVHQGKISGELLENEVTSLINE